MFYMSTIKLCEEGLLARSVQRILRNCIAMPTHKVNYDAIASTYNGRYAADGLAGAAQALTALMERQPAGRVLEVGCGTGHWLNLLKPRVRQAVGLDLSPGMLEQARRGGLRLLACGQAAQLPFPARCFDVVFAVNAIHHFPDPQQFIVEAYRLLRPGGTLAIVGMDPHRRKDRWYIYDYFPGTYEADLRRFPSGGTLLDWMTRAGYKRVDWQVVEHIHDRLAGAEVLKSHFLAKEGTSQLSLLTDGAYCWGIDHIRAAIAEAEKNKAEVIFQADIDLAMITGIA